MCQFQIVEKKNPLALHGLFDSVSAAAHHLYKTIPEYVSKGYFMDKTLKADDFKIVECKKDK